MYLWTATIAYGVMGVALLRTNLVIVLTALAFVASALVTIWPWLRKRRAVHTAAASPK